MDYLMKQRPPMIVQLFKAGDIEAFGKLLGELPLDARNALITETALLSTRFSELFNDETNMQEMADSIRPFRNELKAYPTYREGRYYLSEDYVSTRVFHYAGKMGGDDKFTLFEHQFDDYQDLLNINWEEVNIQMTKPCKIKS